MIKLDNTGKMLSWASYLFGGSSTAETDEKEVAQAEQVAMDTEATGDKDWVVVEHKDCCFGNQLAAHRSHVTCYPGMRYHGDYTTDSNNISPSKSDSSSSPSKQSTPNSLSPVSCSRHLYVRTRHGHSEAWILTPPSCFTAGDGQAPQVGVSDLENLLIEHPSMSVYKRSGSEGDDSNESESSIGNVKSKRSQALTKPSPKRLRAVSARAELLAQVSQVKNAQTKQQVSSTKRQKKRALERSNKVAVSDKHVARKSRVRKPSGQMNGRVSQRMQ